MASVIQIASEYGLNSMILAVLYDLTDAFAEQPSLRIDQGIPIVGDYGGLVYLSKANRCMSFRGPLRVLIDCRFNQA
ncbi:conserved protein of unknown function [Candidatus Methylacidiphilum fumarolicum]|nr:conserved protein of unknown function [Candidatus Methylacidiphilum fumarolicum]